MSSYISLLVLCLLLVLASSAWSTQEERGEAKFAVVGYLPEWRYAGANFERMCEVMTHLIFFSVEPTPEGGITGMDRFPPADVLEASRNKGCELIICFGGNGRSSGFSAMTRNKKSRKSFVKRVRKMVKQFELDGVDYNWEYPGYGFSTGYGKKAEVDADYEGLIALLRETRRAIPNKTISLAYYPDSRQEQTLVRLDAAKYVDYMHIMAYDQHSSAAETSHSSLPFALKVMKQGRDLGLPPQKLTLGVPFYGRHSSTGDWTTYEDLVQQHHPLDPSEDKVVLKKSSSVIAFNGIKTIGDKVRHAVSESIGGVMIWEAGQDCRLSPVSRGGKTHPATCPLGNDSSLLIAIDRVLSEFRTVPSIMNEL